MNENLVGAFIAFALGIGVACLNFLLSKAILTKQPEKYALSTIIRQIMQILYIVAVYFVSTVAPWDTWYMLIGAVLGVTVPMVYFTHKLLQLNKAVNTKDNKKEGENNG